MFESFSHVMMYVTDLDRATTWYTDVLGFTVGYSAPGQYASLKHESSGVRLDLHPTDDASQVGKGPLPNFDVSDLDAALTTLKEKGVTIGEITDIGHVRFCDFNDSEGNSLQFQEAR